MTDPDSRVVAEMQARQAAAFMACGSGPLRWVCVSCGRRIHGSAISLPISPPFAGSQRRHIYYHPACAAVVAEQLAAAARELQA